MLNIETDQKLNKWFAAKIARLLVFVPFLGVVSTTFAYIECVQDA